MKPAVYYKIRLDVYQKTLLAKFAPSKLVEAQYTSTLLCFFAVEFLAILTTYSNVSGEFSEKTINIRNIIRKRLLQ